ncbi:MAG: sugar-binding domain-containing protein [Bacteroidota bacterium]
MKIKKPISIVIVVLILFAIPNAYSQEGTDVFQQIAQQKISEVPGIVANPAPELPRIVLPFDKKATNNFTPLNKIDTQEELDTELEKMRKHYAVFLQDLAKPIQKRKTIEFEKFNWRLAEYYEQNNSQFAIEGLGRWEEVTVPHYSGPSGKAVSYYRTEFFVSDSLFNADALYLHFQAVDYYADIFVNGKTIGKHEGLFDSFEFNIKPFIKLGNNILLVRVENDGSPIGTTPPYQAYQWAPNFNHGSKLAAYGGPGWDDPYIGWNCTPAGFGIWQRVWLEARNNVFVNDIFVQANLPKKQAEVWVEIGSLNNTDNIKLDYSLYGQNFKAVIVQHKTIKADYQKDPVSLFHYPQTTDSLIKDAKVQLVKFTINIPSNKLKFWTPDSPWLYQLQIFVSKNGKLLDNAKQQFGMRSFVQSTSSVPKGRFYLNGKEIRLRGANMMGNIMQCVMRKDYKQLIDDILLAKIANNNFWRMTQQPCQQEAYEYFDKLGLMAQSDMPSFHYIPYEKREEYLRQTGALIRMVRSHPSNSVVSYINEPMKGTRDTITKRLTEKEEVALFRSCDSLVSIVNPNQVVKWIDGDYQNLSEGYSDHHCYNLWYWKHTIPFSEMYKGKWTKTRAGWMHGCGEYGTEGMDDVTLMRKYYPKEWLPTTEDEAWTPAKIPGCQSARQGFKRWIGNPTTMSEWVNNSRTHQQYSTRLIVEALRRDAKMNSTAIHLLIDAWPNGWLKTIMDYDRKAKPAYFEFRDAQTPLAANLKPENFYYFTKDTVKIEAWNCNDTQEKFKKAICKYQVEMNGKIIISGNTIATISACNPMFQGNIEFIAPKVKNKEIIKVKYALIDKSGKVMHDTSVEIEIYPEKDKNTKLENPGGKWQFLIKS